MEIGPERAPSLGFDIDHVGRRQPWKISHRGLVYQGEVIVAETPDPSWYEELEGDLDFRLVFFTVPRRLPGRRIADRRIAMAVPVRTPDSERQSVGQEIRAIREARDRYASGDRPDSAGLRKAMDERERALGEALAGRFAVSYSQGRIYTHPEIGIRPRDVFAGDNLEAWADRLASSVLLLAFPAPQIDSSAFPGALDSNGVASIFGGLFQGDARALRQVESYGPGLGLTTKASPAAFDASACLVFGIIESLLAESGESVECHYALRALTLGHGLTRPLALLYLLAYVRHAGAEIELRPGHAVESARGGPFLADRITWDLVPDVAFSRSLVDQITALNSSSSDVEGAVRPYVEALVGRSIVQGAGGPSEAARGGLLPSLARLSATVAGVRDALRTFSSVPGGSPPWLEDLLTRLDRLSQVADLGEFLATVRKEFDGPVGLSDSLTRLRGLESLGEASSDIARYRWYLGGMTFGGRQSKLALERDAVAARLDPGSLVGTPSAWSGSAAAFGRLRARYAAEYTSYHEEYHKRSASLRNRLEAIRPQIEAISWFGEVPELGAPVGVDLPELYKGTYESILTCRLRPEELRLQEVPRCESCLLPLDRELPLRSVEEVLGQAAAAMREYNRRLGTEAARRALARPTRAQVDRFAQLVQVADPSALANVLSEEVVEFLRQFMGDR